MEVIAMMSQAQSAEERVRSVAVSVVFSPSVGSLSSMNGKFAAEASYLGGYWQSLWLRIHENPILLEDVGEKFGDETAICWRHFF